MTKRSEGLGMTKRGRGAPDDRERGGRLAIRETRSL
jgi:hypothetical protein